MLECPRGTHALARKRIPMHAIKHFAYRFFLAAQNYVLFVFSKLRIPFAAYEIMHVFAYQVFFARALKM